MPDHRDLEAWADALLDQHRSEPRRAPAASPEDALLAQLRDASRERHHRLSRAYALVTIAGVVLALGFFIAWAQSV